MLKRKLYDELLKWKNENKEECLLIKGARQVGKTYLVRKFGEAEYESFIEINFHMQGSLKVIFENDLSSEEICKRITANIAGSRIIPGKTLIFLDEIQKCSRARTALKFLAQDNRIDVIASGSLLGLAYGRDDDKEVEEVESMPVGYERPLMMYPLDFEEFLNAYGYDSETIEYLHGFYNSKEKVPSELNDKFSQIFLEYLVVGGMPEVVVDFVENKDFGSREQSYIQKIR